MQADVFERDVHNITVGQRANVTTTAYPDEHFIAQVAQVGSVVDAQTRTAKVRIQVANRDARLKPGMFAEVSLSLPQTSALTLPMRRCSSRARASSRAGSRFLSSSARHRNGADGSDRFASCPGLSPAITS